jgi:hypothetical protein
MANTRPIVAEVKNQPLEGTRDGTNTIFNTPTKFLYSDDLKISINIDRAGVKQKINDDYTIDESAGQGTGFDTIIFKRPPRPLEYLSCDYIRPFQGV